MNLTVPNLLSIFRMMLIPLFVTSLLDGRAGRALVVFGIAGATDALDGFIARFWNQKSALGAYLDPLADKLLLVTAYVVLAIPGLHSGVVLPIWLSALVITRDVVIVAVALVLSLATGARRFPPSLLSKFNTAAQIGAVLLVLLSGVSGRFDLAATVAIYIVAASTLLSSFDYLYRANRLTAER